MKMERVFEIIRGWPQDGSLDNYETIASGVTLVNGDVVYVKSDGTIDKVGATANGKVGVVVFGNGDEPSCAVSNKALVVWGNYIAKFSNASGSFAPGDGVTGKNGVPTKDAGTDPTFGFVTKVVAASGTETAHIIVVVK